MPTRTLSLELVNRRGLHARAAARFVRELERYRADATVSKDGHDVDGRSIMGLLMLGAPCGSTVTVVLSGDDADEAAAMLTELVSGGFGESE
ncbi:HPr family phosphocarrier protein [Acuticoccus kandeliae]|uniref:HPr family phosphocarrier protein n=1 Tax=Acuticoccus kandeliae TaxID=2073160 RepID=UPI003CCC3C68